METIWEVVATGLFFVAAAVLFLRWLAQSGAKLSAPFDHPLPGWVGQEPERKRLAMVFTGALVFRLLFALGSLLLYNMFSEAGVGLRELPQLWVRWDAQHYVKLAELGYGGYIEDGKPLFLVFYPLYVWLTRAMAWLIPNTVLAGMTVSALCFAGGCVYLYQLAAEEYGEKVARRTLWLLCAFPFAFFFGGVMTESLFFLTTAAGLYHIRKHEWLRFAFWGILAAMTRMQGVLLIGAAAAELCCQVKPFEPGGRGRWGELFRCLPLLCLPAVGAIVYFGLNYCVAGDPFAFTVMQEHWSQGFMWFPKVLSYLAKNAFTWPDVLTRWEMWIPELVLFPAFAVLLCRSWKKHRSMFTLYAFVYFILNYCLSWLLSAGRYLSCALPCFFFAADELKEKPRLTVTVLAAMIIFQIFLLYRYLCWGQVM